MESTSGNITTPSIVRANSRMAASWLGALTWLQNTRKASMIASFRARCPASDNRARSGRNACASASVTDLSSYGRPYRCSVLPIGLAEPSKDRLALDHSLLSVPEPTLGFVQPRLGLGYPRQRGLDALSVQVRACHSTDAP